MRPKASAEIARDRLIFVVMTVAVCMVATEARRSRRPDYCDQKTRHSSFLWKVQTKPPSYFFGTIHVPFNRVWEHVPENVKRAFHLADAVFFELDLTDASTVSALTTCQRLPRGARLRQLLPADMYRRLQKHLDYVRHMMPLWMSADQRGRGLYADYLFNAITGDWQQKRPVWVMLMVNTLTESGVRSRGVPVLDLYLALEAEKRNKRTGAVERVEEQCLPLNGLNISQVVFALNQTLSQHESMRAGGGAPAAYTTDDLIRHYNCGDLDEVIFRRDSAQIPPSVFQVPPLQSAATAAASAASAAQRVTAHSIDAYFREELIYKRNQRMGERILELIWARPGTSYFFAFGAGHFLGNYTVLDVIRRGGYKVTQVGPHEPVRRYKRRRRPGGAETDVSRSRAEEPAPAAPSPGRGQVTARADQLAAASPRAKKYTENFSDLWVRIDDQSKSRSSVSEASDAAMQVVLDWPSPSSGGSAAATVGGASRSLLAVLLLIVMAVSPPRT